MSVKGKAGCPLCNGTGYKVGDWGMSVVCDCVIEQMNATDQKELDQKQTDQTQQIITVSNTNVYLQQIINDGIITPSDLKLEYSRDYTLKSLKERCEALHLKVSKSQVSECLDVLDSILTSLRLGQLPTKSYAIGAENGIGKTTFALTAIKLAAQQNMKVVPYIDMTTLAEKYLEYSQQVRSLYEQSGNGQNINLNTLNKKFGWCDYVEADLCIVSLTGGNANIAYVELDTLLTLLTKRSDRRKPTIVLMRVPVEYYVKFNDVRRYLIKELFNLKGKAGSYCMLEKYSMFTREPSE